MRAPLSAVTPVEATALSWGVPSRGSLGAATKPVALQLQRRSFEATTGSSCRRRNAYLWPRAAPVLAYAATRYAAIRYIAHLIEGTLGATLAKFSTAD